MVYAAAVFLAATAATLLLGRFTASSLVSALGIAAAGVALISLAPRSVERPQPTIERAIAEAPEEPAPAAPPPLVPTTAQTEQ
jgi:hypothetical protein